MATGNMSWLGLEVEPTVDAKYRVDWQQYGGPRGGQMVVRYATREWLEMAVNFRVAPYTGEHFISDSCFESSREEEYMVAAARRTAMRHGMLPDVPGPQVGYCVRLQHYLGQWSAENFPATTNVPDGHVASRGTDQMPIFGIVDGWADDTISGPPTLRVIVKREALRIIEREVRAAASADARVARTGFLTAEDVDMSTGTYSRVYEAMIRVYRGHVVASNQ
ncbi:MAG: hypothetical protein WC773_00455 [Patescibacteria group bacterium]|jgi:hypothetical protein